MLWPTSEPGIALLVWTADCVPVILVGPQAVAVAHAGWRGCAAGVVRNTVETLGVPTAELCAYLGPSISAAHYEVGPEVIHALTATGVPVSAWLDGSSSISGSSSPSSSGGLASGASGPWVRAPSPAPASPPTGATALPPAASGRSFTEIKTTITEPVERTVEN